MAFWTELLSRIARRQGSSGDTFPVSITGGVNEAEVTDDGELKVKVDSSALPTGAATKAMQDYLADVLDSILAKIIAAPATEAKQDTAKAVLDSIDGKDFATQTTLAAILAKIIAAPATSAKQDSMITALGTLLTKTGFDAKQDLKVSELRDALRGVSNKTLSDLATVLATLATSAKQDSILAQTDIKLSALRDAITAVGANAKTLKDVFDKLTSLETEIKAIKESAGVKKIADGVDINNFPEVQDVQLSGAIPEYNWFAGEERPEPAEPAKPAIGVEVDAETGDMVGLLWNGEDWEEV